MFRFNPIAPTLMKRALQHLLTTHFSQNSGIQPSKEVLDIITESSNGDIRSAIMALQFACVRPNPGFELPEKTKGKGKSKKGNVNARMIVEAVTRREQSLALFHLIGKILYNKRSYRPVWLCAFMLIFMQAKGIRRLNLLRQRIENVIGVSTRS